MTSDQQSPPPKQADLSHRHSSGLSAFWAELKRRKVMRVAITYIVASIAIIEFASVTFEGFGIPIWAFRFVMLMVIMGFPLAIILAWAFELTPDGIKTTKTAREENVDTEDAKAHSKKRNWLAYAVGALFPTVIFGALALFFYVQTRTMVSESEPTIPDSVAEVEVPEKSIAVLPLENMSPDPDNAFFADGVQEDILTNLARISEFHVIARTSTQQYRNTTKTVGVIGEELGVNYLVEGSVRRAGNRVKVTVQLIDCGSGDHLWAEDYDRGLDDIFAIQAEVAKEIARQLEAVLSPKEVEKIEYRPTENQEAYDYYLKHRLLGGGQEKIDLLEKAVALDPEFAEAWAALVTETIFWWDNGRNRSDPELRERAHYALKEAERTGPDLPHLRIAKHTMALRDDRDLEKAVEYLLEALAIDPTFYLAHTRLGQRYYQLGRLAEAQHHVETALKTDPAFNTANNLLRVVYTARGKFDEARELIHKNNELWGVSDFLMWKLKTINYLQTGRKPEFLEAIESDSRFNDAPTSQIARTLLSKDYSEAIQLIEGLEYNSRFSFTALGNDAYDYSIRPPQLLAALIYFHQDDRENLLVEAKKAETYIKDIIDENPIVSPRFWSLLSICQALKGDSGQFPSTVEKIREMTASKHWKYHSQVHCELHIAIAYLVLGDHDKAIETLEAASKMDGPIFLNRELDLWFIFDRLRGNPRFDALLED